LRVDEGYLPGSARNYVPSSLDGRTPIVRFLVSVPKIADRQPGLPRLQGHVRRLYSQACRDCESGVRAESLFDDVASRREWEAGP